MKSSIKELSFLCAYFSWIVFNILYASTIPLPNWSAALMKSIVLLLLLVSMLYGFKLHPNEIVRIGAVTFAVVAAAVLGKTNSLFISYAFVVAASSQDVKRVYKIALFAYLIGVITVAFLAVVGIIDNNVVARGGTSRVRSPMGFTHVNTCGAYLLMIGIMWFYNYYSEKRFKSNIVLGSLIFILVKFIDSRTATVILALVLLLCIVVEKDGVVLPKFFDYSYIIVAIFSLILAVCYSESNGIIVAIDTILSGRISYLHQFYKEYGPSLLGQPLYLMSSIESQMGLGTAAMLDNGYGHMVIRYGIVLSTMLVFAFTKLLKLVRRKKDSVLYICLVAFAIYYFMEASMTVLVYNPFLLCLGGFLRKKEM